METDMTSRALNLIAAAALACVAGTAAAQASSSVTFYGTIDEYAGYFRSSSGTSLKGLYDGAFLRTRWGFRGVEDLGGGLTAKFQLEGGINADTGTSADATRGFDRQSWVGLAGAFGEVRLGRQNGSIFYKGDYIDFTSRTLGSMVNNFGVPSRYDNAFMYISPRMAGLQLDAQVSIAETGNGALKQGVIQGSADYVNGPFRVGYAALRAKPPANATYGASVFYDNAYFNYDYGQGKVYLAYVRSNNSASTAVSNNAGTILGNVGGVVAGTNADVNRTYRIVQGSVDYRVMPSLRVGVLYGKITDTSGYYDLSKRTMLYSLANTIKNDRNAGFRPSGSAGLAYNFSTPNDIHNRRLDGMQFGVLHRF